MGIAEASVPVLVPKTGSKKPQSQWGASAHLCFDHRGQMIDTNGRRSATLQYLANILAKTPTFSLI